MVGVGHEHGDLSMDKDNGQYIDVGIGLRPSIWIVGNVAMITVAVISEDNSTILPATITSSSLDVVSKIQCTLIRIRSRARYQEHSENNKHRRVVGRVVKKRDRENTIHKS
jgi:hypothetical protein